MQKLPPPPPVGGAMDGICVDAQCWAHRLAAARSGRTTPMGCKTDSASMPSAGGLNKPLLYQRPRQTPYLEVRTLHRRPPCAARQATYPCRSRCCCKRCLMWLQCRCDPEYPTRIAHRHCNRVYQVGYFYRPRRQRTRARVDGVRVIESQPPLLLSQVAVACTRRRRSELC